MTAIADNQSLPSKRNCGGHLPRTDNSGVGSSAAARVSLAAVLAGTVAFAGCGGSGDRRSTPGTTQPSGSAQLKFFVGDDGCAQLESHIETSVETTLRKQLEGCAGPAATATSRPLRGARDGTGAGSHRGRGGSRELLDDDRA